MSEQVNLLSIDWDYFINASSFDRANLFPDGGNENLPDHIKNVVWSSHYIDGSLKKISVDKTAVDILRKCLKKNLNPGSKIWVYDSHKYAYNHFVSEITQSPCKVNICNVDFHHDIYNLGDDEIDCGNWLRLLLNDCNIAHATWICRDDSDMPETGDSLSVSNDLNSILEKSWDAVFICRSSMWSPPHLDKDFIKILNLVRKLDTDTCSVSIERELFTDRFGQIRDMVKQMKGVINSTRL